MAGLAAWSAGLDAVVSQLAELGSSVRSVVLCGRGVGMTSGVSMAASARGWELLSAAMARLYGAGVPVVLCVLEEEVSTVGLLLCLASDYRIAVAGSSFVVDMSCVQGKCFGGRTTGLGLVGRTSRRA